MKKVTVLFALIVVSATAQKKEWSIDQLKTYPVPTNYDTLLKYNNAVNEEYTVVLRNDSVLVQLPENRYDEDTLPFPVHSVRNDDFRMTGWYTFHQVDDGYIVGFNRGEWGGLVYWFSGDGKKHYEISDHQLGGFIEKEGKLFAFAGLAHLSPPYYGDILLYEKIKGVWTETEYVDLNDAPAAITLDKEGNFIVVAAQKLLKVGPGKKITDLEAKMDWLGLYPGSIVICKETAYISMRKGILKHSLVTGEEKWLMPK